MESWRANRSSAVSPSCASGHFIKLSSVYCMRIFLYSRVSDGCLCLCFLVPTWQGCGCGSTCFFCLGLCLLRRLVIGDAVARGGRQDQNVPFAVRAAQQSNLAHLFIYIVQQAATTL